MVQEHVTGSGRTEGPHAHEAHGRGELGREELGHGGTHAAPDHVLLAGHDAARLGRGRENRVLVERLDAEHVDHLGGDALLGELVGGGERLGDLDATGEEADIGALPQDLGLAECEVGIGVIDLRDGMPAHANVERSRRLGGDADGRLGGAIVRRNEHAHVGEHAHHADVLERLVRGTVLAHRDAGVRGAHLDVEVRVADGVPDLVVAPAGPEDGEGAREGDASGERETSGDVHHVLLGDADVDETVRIGLPEHAGLGGTCEVGIDGDDVHALVHKLDERLAVCLARCPLSHCRPPSRGELARRRARRAPPLPGHGWVRSRASLPCPP